MAQPPIHAWMPNQPQATSARSSAGTLAPRMPKDGRQYTGNGMPYLVPAWALRTIGTSTMQLPSVIVSTACHQFIPSAMSEDASMYVGTHAHMLIQRTMMSFMAQVRSDLAVALMSSFQ